VDFVALPDTPAVAPTFQRAALAVGRFFSIAGSHAMNRRLFLLAAAVFSVGGLAALVSGGPRRPPPGSSLPALDSLLAPAAARAADVDSSAPILIVQPAPADPLPADDVSAGGNTPSTNGGAAQPEAATASRPGPLTIYMPRSEPPSKTPSNAPLAAGQPDNRENHQATSRRHEPPRAPELQPVSQRHAAAPVKQAAPPREPDQFLPRPRAVEPSSASSASQAQHTATPQATPFATQDQVESTQPTLNVPSMTATSANLSSTAADHDADALARAASSDDGAGVSLRWITPTTASLGQEATCQLVVRNMSATPALAVLVEVHLPKSVAASHCDPAPTEDGQLLTWNLGNLPAGAAKTLQMGLTATERAALSPTAAVTCTRAAMASIEITEPRLELTVVGPQQAVLGQAATFHFRAQNSGSGPAANVVLEVQLAEGLQHAQGPNPQYRIGTLEPGESRQVQVPVIGTTDGQHAIEGVVMLGATAAAKAQCAVDFVRPTLDIAVDGPKLRYVDRKASYVVKVQNPGPAAIENVQLLQHVPEGFRFVEASSGGSFDRSARQVAWFVGRLEPNESASVGIELIASESGDHRVSAAAKADDGVIGKADVVTHVESVPSLVLDVTEDDDPVEVDSETVYRIHITNHGTRPATHVQIAAEVPNEMEILKVNGPGVGAVKGQQIVFPPLAALDPGKSEEYQVRVQCKQPGQTRFRAFLRHDDTPNTVIEEEQTRIYADEGLGSRQ
jgi:uncharacterized repeat protein (TIGR01451 family)